MVTLHCAGCNIAFCLPQLVYERRLQDGKSFFCPNGHGNEFRPSENAKSRKQVEQLNRQVLALKDEIRYLHHRLDNLEHDVKYYRGQASGYKGQWVLLKKRFEQESPSIN